MKYFVSKITKQHIPVSRALPWVREGDDWRIVEADSEGWIPWRGIECPLPDDCKCEIKTKEGPSKLPREAGRWTWAHNIRKDKITHYRHILAEKEEISVVKESLTTESVFDRLKSAITASESIQGIIAEIDALLPDGYCVFRCGSQPAKETDNANN